MNPQDPMTHPRKLADKLSALGACNEAIEWAQAQTDDATAWRECRRGDWMLWLLGQIDVDRKRLVLATCGCARLSLHIAPDGEDRPRIAIETAEAWARGDGPTLDDVRRSASAAYAAADAASYAAYAAHAAYRSARPPRAGTPFPHAASYAASYAAYAASYAANAAAYAANAAAYAANTTLSHCADIVRTHFPEVPHVQ